MKLWFSIFDKNDYKGNEPDFFNPDEYAFSKIICDHYAVINQELIAYLEKNKLPSYFNSSMVDRENSWKTISLKTWDVENYENYKFFPETLQIIKSIPSLVSASFTLLEPNSRIVAHCGDTNGIFRCHLGLSIPGKIPACGFRVGNEWRSWENGKLLVFTDAINHEAVNHTNQNRYIFLFDIIRPECIAEKRLICSTVLAALFLQKLAEAFKIFYKSPLWVQKVSANLLIPLVYIAIPVRNFLYKFKK
jgi:aspartyl/asparaginyl beta-hydroxylase (cupin superfamily)